ncbi:ATP-binding cassette domain-containing protein [Kribbella sp. NPDC050241]|uniref:ATP-binding cassette domain-containing protein n=1 Tax=Kribbella sp. NPDC050241 TaxID=3364115 RepID=UPI0037916AFA
MSTQLSLHDVTKSYDHRVVLDQVTCAFPPGQVSGLIGENGSGKSTMLRILAGLEPPTDGTVTAAGSIGYLAQDNPLPLDLDVNALADHALADLRRIESRTRDLELLLAEGRTDVLDEYGELQTVFELREGYDADARFARATHGLGLSTIPGDRRLSDLSGGELARLHLAAALASAPEILLLDEPTNHLDHAVRRVAARRTHQSPVARPGGGTGGGPRPVRRCARRGQPRPPVHLPLARSRPRPEGDLPCHSLSSPPPARTRARTASLSSTARCGRRWSTPAWSRAFRGLRTGLRVIGSISMHLVRGRV